MRSFFEGEGSIIQYYLCPYNKRCGDIQKKTLCDDGGRDQSDMSTGQGMPRIAGNTRS